MLFYQKNIDNLKIEHSYFTIQKYFVLLQKIKTDYARDKQILWYHNLYVY